MKQLNMHQIAQVAGGHWVLGPDGHLRGSGSTALESIAQENGGQLSQKMGPGADTVLLSAVLTTLGTVGGPVGGMIGIGLGQAYDWIKNAIQQQQQAGTQAPAAK